MKTEEFALREVLALVTKNVTARFHVGHLDSLYRFLTCNRQVVDVLEALEECRAYLLKVFPGLVDADADLDRLLQESGPDAHVDAVIRVWVLQQREKLGKETFQVNPMPKLASLSLPNLS